VTQRRSTGLEVLTDNELRTHTRIMLEGTGHRGPQSWPMDNLDEDIYQEIERRVPALAELRLDLDHRLAEDLERRQAADPATADVPEYTDNGQEWADKDAERAWDQVRDRWRAGMVRWLEAGHDDA
jgi:hypothetical protein